MLGRASVGLAMRRAVRTTPRLIGAAPMRAAAPRFNSTASKLSSFLQVEVEEEQENQGPKLADLFTSDFPFTLDASETKGTSVVMRSGDKSVHYDAADLEVEDENGVGLPFELVVANSELKRELIFDLIVTRPNIEDTGDVELNIEGITVRRFDQDADQDSFSPKFEELEEHVKESFYDYLDAMGVAADTAGVILEMAETVEGAAYRQWLGDVKSFVDATK